MSIVKNSIALFSNLPSGGASELARLNFTFFDRNANVTYLSDSEIKPRNILHYLYICIFKLPAIHMRLANKISENSTCLVVYHSWLTKSPHILRYAQLPKIYICQETMREYYDSKHISNQTIRDKIVNLIRLPLKFIDKKNLQSSKVKIIANSQFSKSLIDKYYRVSSEVIYPGIDTRLFVKDSANIKKNQVLSVGAINKLKGYEFLINVLSEIEIGNRPTLVLVGNGVDKLYANKLERMANLKQVKLIVKVDISKAKLLNEYRASKVFMYAPINEPFGIVVLEAMASGLPLVVYKYGGGYTEILNENNGLIMDNLDSKKWAYKLENLLSNKKKINRYGNYNLQIVNKKYTADIMNNNIWKLIKSL